MPIDMVNTFGPREPWPYKPPQVPPLWMAYQRMMRRRQRTPFDMEFSDSYNDNPMDIDLLRMSMMLNQNPAR